MGGILKSLAIATHPLVHLPSTLSETTGPSFKKEQLKHGTDLTRRHKGDPIGERIIVSGQVLDDDNKPVDNALVEIWQANAAGRYRHDADQHDAPLDSNFTGCGQTLTDEKGCYRFVTIRPGAYPWHNHENAWRPAHIHFSVFGTAFVARLITQMYFARDPLLPHQPIFNSINDDEARSRLICRFDWGMTMPEQALGYRFDIVLGGAEEMDKLLEEGFSGYGRMATNSDGQFQFRMIKPGAVPCSSGEVQAPHIVVAVFMRGLLRNLVSRIYFPGESLNADDQVLNLVEVGRRETLIAKKHPSKPETLK